jgi:hypothetical protein
MYLVIVGDKLVIEIATARPVRIGTVARLGAGVPGTSYQQSECHYSSQ